MSALIDYLRSQTEALTVPDVMKLLQMKERTVYYHLASGRLPSLRVGKHLRVDPGDLADYFEAQLNAATAPRARGRRRRLQ